MDTKYPPGTFITDLDELLTSSAQSHPIKKKKSAVYRSQNALPRNFKQMKSMPDIGKNEDSLLHSTTSVSLISSDADTLTHESVVPEVYTHIISEGYKPAIYPIKHLTRSDLRAMFDKYDYDKSDTVNHTVLLQLLQEAISDKYPVGLMPKDVVYVLNLFDPTGSGRITFDDFKEIIKVLKGKKEHTRESVIKLREKRINKLKKSSGQFGVELGF